MTQASHRQFHQRLLKITEQFSNVPILVVGDLMVDRSLRGQVDRISPEAPVPVVDVKEETQTPGGAGNVTNNLAVMGARPTLVSVRGEDSIGHQIEIELRNLGVNINGIVVDPHRRTTTKTRVIANHQQVVRFDVEQRGRFSPDIMAELTQKLTDLVPQQKAVIISDYGKGVITPPIIQLILKLARRKKIPVIVDPKIEHFLDYKGVDCITPNAKEACEGMRSLPPKSEEETEVLGKRILKALRSASLLITRGEKGMMLFLKNGAVKSIPTKAREVYDVTGAGDTVISVLTLARAVGASYEEAAHLSNYAASLVVAKLGTAVADRFELQTLLKAAL